MTNLQAVPVVERRMKSFNWTNQRHFYTKRVWSCFHTLLTNRMTLGASANFWHHYLLDTVQWPSPAPGKDIFTELWSKYVQYLCGSFPLTQFLTLPLFTSSFSLSLTPLLPCVLIHSFFSLCKLHYKGSVSKPYLMPRALHSTWGPRLSVFPAKWSGCYFAKFLIRDTHRRCWTTQFY